MNCILGAHRIKQGTEFMSIPVTRARFVLIVDYHKWIKQMGKWYNAIVIISAQHIQP